MNEIYVLWRSSLVAQLVKSLPAVKKIHIQSLDQEDPLAWEWQTTPVFLSGESHG